jgi:hypothetical protein
MSGGNAANGAASRTIRIAASSSTLLPEERLISTPSRLPSARIATDTCSVP